LFACVALAAGLTAVGAGIGVWDAVKYRFIPKRFGVVVPGEVYRSGQISRWQFEPTVRKYDIDAVIDLNGIDPADPDQAAEIASYERTGVEHHRFQLRGDGTGSVENYVEAVATLAECRRDGKTVLVHCHAGTQRTGSVVAAYRVLVLGQSPREAYAELSRYGWNAKTDGVLLEYLNTNLRQVAEELARRGLVGRVPDPFPVVGP
jgi:protein-tyrosine phosphatase